MTTTLSMPQESQIPGDRTAPKASLRLEWVYGYRAANCRSNIHLTENGELVYFSAAVAIVQSIEEKDHCRQRFFLGHDDDIISSCLHPDRKIVATGQIGKNAQICVWNTQGTMKLESLLQGHADGVGAINFSADGEKLASVGIDSNNTIKVWSWLRGKILATVAGHSERVFDICYFGDRVITCGVKHIRFWTLLGNTLEFKEGLFGKSEALTLLCIGTLGRSTTNESRTTNDDESLCFTGAINGDLIVWKKNKIDRIISGAHNSTIYSIDINSNGFLTSGKDGCVKEWTRDFAPTGQSTHVPSLINDSEEISVCSIASHNGYCVAGTRDCEIYGFHLNENNAPQLLVQGHHDSSLFALACHPKENIFVTGGEDCTLRFWNAERMSSITFFTTPYVPLSPPPAIRSIAFTSDGNQIAVGYENGYVEIYRTILKPHEEERVQPIHTMHDHAYRIQSLAFSPHDKYLAVGCNDGTLDIYDVKDQYKNLHFKNTSNSLSVTNMDWTDDEKYLLYTGENKQVFIAKMPSFENLSDKEKENIHNWSTFTSLRHKEVRGIWNKFAEKTDIVTIDGNEYSGVIAAGDEQGLIKLFRFPSEKRGAHFKKYVGHSSRIGNVCFLHDKSRLITIGTDDRTILQWNFLSETDSIALVDTRRLSTAATSFRLGTDDMMNADAVDGTIEDAQLLETAQQAGTYLDSDSEDSDSDLSGAEIDSDIEKEKQISYDRTLYREDYQKLKKTMKEKLPPGEKRKKQPDQGLTLDFVFGYRGYDCRDNVFSLKTGEIIYHVAALGIVLNAEQNVQRFYNCHTDDILCLAVSPDMSLVATGQIGRDPPVHVWDPIKMQTSSILKGQHYRGISALGFSRNGKWLASVGLDDYRTIVIWDWKKGEKLASQRGHNDKIFCLRWNPHDDDRFVTVGVKHIKFWTKAGGGMTSKQGVFGKAAGKQGKQNQMCVVFGKTVDSCITGGGDGSIYIWTGTALTKKIDDAHEGPLFAITAVQDKGYVTGGKDSKIILWDPEFKKRVKTYELTNKNLAPDSRGTLTEDPTAVRAVSLTRRIIVGTRGGEICEIEKDGRIRVVIQGHAEGEMWGLSTNPKKYELCTVSDDKTVRVWSLEDRRMIRFKSFQDLLRTCEYSQNGKYIAVGTKTGHFMILNEADLTVVVTVEHRNQEVSDIKFSPDDRHLAVGTHDNFVDIYNVETQKRVGICKANSSYITHVDWDAKGKLIMTNSGAKEQLFYEAPRGTRITSIKTTDIEKMDWFTWTGVLGLVCEGVWPPATDVTDVNSTDLTKDKQILATGDDFGLVKLFEFPVKGKFAKFKRYTGHSAHVTRVRWTYDNSYLISIGGRDVAALVWKHERNTDVETVPTSQGKITVANVRTTPTNSKTTTTVTASTSVAPVRQEKGESDDSDNTDSEEEGYDSDVQHDRSMDYNARILIDPARTKSDKQANIRSSTATNKSIRAKVKPSQRKINEDVAIVKAALKSSIGLGFLSAVQENSTTNEALDHDQKPRGRIIDLELNHIHGYRSFDCRDNLFYLADNESIVYPAAGTCVVHHVSRGTQNFYKKHTDDIISMAVHNGGKHGNIVASGQIGENPTIHVWNAQTRETISVLSGKHKRGVCSLSFSTSGKLLLSVGVDAPYTIAVWRWEEGINIACAIGSEDRIFRALFRPNSEVHFVTAGVKHLKFWSVAGNTLVEKKAVITKTTDGKRSTKMQTMLSIAFGTDDRTYTGSMTGLVFIWRINALERTIVAHAGPIFSMFSSENCIVTGAKEKRSLGSTQTLNPVKVWDYNMQNGRSIKLDLPQTDTICARSVCRNSQGKMLIGLKTADIVEVDDKQSGSRSVLLVCGHGEGELWALSPHPIESMFATGSYDRNIAVWDMNNKGLVVRRDMGKAIRSISFHADGNLLAVGFQDGQISLVGFSKEKKELTEIDKTRERNAAIVCVRFSPNKKLLVASSNNCSIDFFNIQQNKLARVGYVTHIDDAVLQIDWATNSEYIRASTAGYHALVFHAPIGEEVKNHEEIEKIVWDSWTSTIGDDVSGIWPKDVKKDHINCAHALSSTIVTGDDHGAVNLFKFPCPEPGTEHKSYYGHSDNVTNVRFLANERYLVSLGGDDCCIFVWKCISKTNTDDDD
ncbi:unnamed protein product [Rotaria magnacalcarata]|uniref:Echinoderm microtubule-associated protein-like 6 n=2 Tax=Rotaria magnacalcarata TaxID=392030 RepID=A0A816LM16_9BILA|nr:unnamed protein product [Rotaria magnacalcarata]